MVDLRSSSRRKAGVGANQRKAASSHTSSSSVHASRTLQSDENVPPGRRALGDIKNVVTDRKPTVEVSALRRRPLGDRNAVILPESATPSIETKDSTIAQQTVRSKTRLATRSKTTTAQMEPNSGGLMETIVSTSRRETRRHITSSPPPSLYDKRHARGPRNEAMSQRSQLLIPSDEELARLPPKLDSDDLGYFDVELLESARTEPVALKQGNRDQEARSKEQDSSTRSSASHGSSDKENLPPPSTAAYTTAGLRQTVRPRVGVLSAIGGDQPSHSTPVSQKRNLAKLKASSSNYLDDVFLDRSERSRTDSPGVARRVEPLSASAQQLLDYQDRGVTKVMAWKAEGHDQAGQSPHGHSIGRFEDDLSSVGSWPAGDGSGLAAGGRELCTDRDDADEFGFLVAEHNIRLQKAQALTEEEQDDVDDINVVWVEEDFPADSPLNDTSDDRRLAEHAFGRMSSPAADHREDASSITELGSITYTGHQQVEIPSASEDGSGEEDDVVVKMVSKVGSELRPRRSTRVSAKRFSKGDSEESLEDLYGPQATRQSTSRSAKARQSASGIPLKRNEKGERAMLDLLAAEIPSSPVPSTSPLPKARRTQEGSSSSSANKRLRMDEIVAMLPRRNQSLPKPPARKGKVKAKGNGSGSNARPGSTRPKAPASEDDLDEMLSRVPASKSTKGSTASRAKKFRPRAQPKERDAQAEDWKNRVNSSQIHSDDSERTKRLKEFRAADKYELEVETVL